jgi:hypothetical protein
MIRLRNTITSGAGIDGPIPNSPNPLAPANSRRPCCFLWSGKIRRRPASSGLGSGSSPDEVLLLPPITAELLPESETRFFERLSGRPMTFSRNTGKVTGLTMKCQGKVFSCKKISDQPPNALEPVKPHVAIKLSPKLLDAIVGHYEFAREAPFPTGGKVTIWREGDQLVCQVWGENAIRGAFDIYPESETNFFIKLNGAQLTFIKNDKGEVTSVIHHSSRTGVPDSVGKKVSDAAK